MDEDRMIRSFLAEAPPSADVVAEGRRRLLTHAAPSAGKGDQRLVAQTPPSAKRRFAARTTPFRLALAGLAVTTVTASALAFALNSGSDHHTLERVQVTGGAAALLDRIADVAYSQPMPTVRDDMYMYVKSKDAEPAGKDPTPPHLRQTWTPVADLCTFGYLIEGRGGGRVGYDMSPCPNKGTLSMPSYRLLETLPTDPRALLKLIYAEPRDSSGPKDPSQQAFNAIGNLLYETVTPPKLTAALYRAAAMIPGVTVDPRAVDAIGRHGVAVTHIVEISPGYNERVEWIFDSSSLQLIGERDVLLRGGLPGAMNFVDRVIHTSAVLQRGFADKPGQAP